MFRIQQNVRQFILISVGILLVFSSADPVSASGNCDETYAQALAQGRIEQGAGGPVVARVIGMFGSATIRGCLGHRRLSSESVVEIDSCIETESSGRVRLMFVESTNSRFSFVDIASSTKVCISHFRPFQPLRAVMDLVRGGLRSISQGWGAGSVFNVKAGTTITGFRGTDGVVFFQRNAGAVVAALHEGRMTVATGGKRETLGPNQFVAVRNGSMEQVQQLSGTQWRKLIEKTNVSNNPS